MILDTKYMGEKKKSEYTVLEYKILDSEVHVKAPFTASTGTSLECFLN